MNEEAYRNIPSMFVTWLVFQPLRSSLNVLYVEQYTPPTSFQSESKRLNQDDISVTALVSHVLMWPYVLVAVVESSHHAVTAVRRLAVSVMAVMSRR